MKSDKVLIIGYGKIGRIKSRIWRSLGIEAIVYDIDQKAALSAYQDDFNVYHPSSSMSGDYMLDISTPAGQHFKALAWATSHGAGDPNVIIIEKPLVSTLEEASALEGFIQTTSGRTLEDKIFVNESYYSSSALALVRDSILESGESIEAFEMELSKNRLMDNDQGRFFDAALGAVGIEVPHMLATLQMFGLRPELLVASRATLLIDHMRPDNQAFLLQHCYAGVDIKLTSYLGDFRLQSGRLVKNEGIVRELRVTTNKTCYRLEFDPVAILPRYYTKLHTLSATTVSQPQAIVDDHLRKHMSLCAASQESAHTDLFGLENAILIAKTLMAIRHQCQIHVVGAERLSVIDPYRSKRRGV